MDKFPNVEEPTFIRKNLWK